MRKPGLPAARSSEITQSRPHGHKFSQVRSNPKTSNLVSAQCCVAFSHNSCMAILFVMFRSFLCFCVFKLLFVAKGKVKRQVKQDSGETSQPFQLSESAQSPLGRPYKGGPNSVSKNHINFRYQKRTQKTSPCTCLSWS